MRIYEVTAAFLSYYHVVGVPSGRSTMDHFRAVRGLHHQLHIPTLPETYQR
jgi:hypothetical protein